MSGALLQDKDKIDIRILRESHLKCSGWTESGLLVTGIEKDDDLAVSRNGNSSYCYYYLC